MSSNRSSLPVIDRVSRFILGNARKLLIAAVVLTGLSLGILIDFESGKPRLEIDPSIDRLLSQGDEEVEYYGKVRETFGGGESFVVTVTADDVFAPEVIARISAVSGRLEMLPRVERVVSLSNTPVPFAQGDELIVISLDDALAEFGEEGIEGIKQGMLASPIYRGVLVTRQQKASAIVIYTDTGGDFSVRQELDEAISGIVEEERASVDMWLTGEPHTVVAITRLLLTDLLRIAPIVIVVLASVLAFSFRNLFAVAIPLVTVALSAIWSLALITLLGYSLNIVTVLVPPLLLVLGLSYSVHVVAEYRMVIQEGADDRPPIMEVLTRVSLPTLLTGVTTVIGFLSLLLSPVEAIREFGILTVIGTLFATATALALTPSMLVFFKPMSKQAPPEGENRRETLFDRMVDRVALFDTRHKTPIFVGAAVIAAVAIAGTTQVRVGYDYMDNLPPGSEARTAVEKTQEHLEGTAIFHVIVDAAQNDAWQEPVNLAVLKEIQEWLESQPEVAATTSIVDYLAVINPGFEGKAATGERQIPGSRTQISQMLFFGASDDTWQFVDRNYRRTNIIVRIPVLDSDSMLDLIARVRGHLARLPHQYQARVTGYPVLVGGVLENVITGQAESVLFALTLVYCILSALFLSLRIGAIALIPNVLPVVGYFGALGIFGITLSPATSVVAPMVLGLAIDDTIHYFMRFNRQVRDTADQEAATIQALRHVGRPVTYTTMGLCLGFLALTTAEVKMQADVGIMACFALAFAWVADFILTPALCARTRFVTLGDVLSQDLGSKPQESMRLFKGLSGLETRIFAQLACIRDVPAGERIIEYGKTGNEMYAIIGGQLRASIEGEAGRVDLGTYGRGDLVGEAGLYYGRRTANVDVVEDARLLCVNQQSLERLQRRYPRILGKVMRNLNEVLAERLDRATVRLA